MITTGTHNDRLPLEVDVVDAHHLLGRKSNGTKYNVNIGCATKA